MSDLPGTWTLRLLLAGTPVFWVLVVGGWWELLWRLGVRP